MEQQDSSDLDTSSSSCPPVPPPQEVPPSQDVPPPQEVPPPPEVSSLDEAFTDLHSEDFQRHSETDGVSPPFSSRCMTRSESDEDLEPKPKPKNKNNVQCVKKQPKKADPVARYHHYKQLWEARKPPGEADRRALRWETRNELAKRQIPHTRTS